MLDSFVFIVSTCVYGYTKNVYSYTQHPKTNRNAFFEPMMMLVWGGGLEGGALFMVLSLNIHLKSHLNSEVLIGSSLIKCNQVEKKVNKNITTKCG